MINRPETIDSCIQLQGLLFDNAEDGHSTRYRHFKFLHQGYLQTVSEQEI